MRLFKRLLSTAFAAGFSLWLAPGSAFADGGPVHTLDLRALFNAAPADVEGRREAYDTLVAAACVQGIANRAGANLYLFYVTSVVDGAIDTDQLWFDRVKDPVVGGDLLTGRKVVALGTVQDAIDVYGAQIAGLVVWDEKVPATVNAAFVAAGADDLVAVRWDASPNSLFAKLSAKMPVKVWLVNPDGSSKFLDKQGAANVPDTGRQTSQSAKADAHVWALEKYLKVPGKLDPTEYGYMLDGRWVQNPNDYAGNANATNQLQISNRDFLVMKRGFPFDLSPWSDVAPNDDPGQPPGTDPAILKEIMAAGRAAAGDEVLTVRGFFGWQFKYTTLEGLPPGHEPVQGEWNIVKLISPYAAGLDADAPGIATMANASFFSHIPLPDLPEPQPRPTPEDLVGAGFLGGLADNGGFEDMEEGWTVQTLNHVVYTDSPAGPASAHTGLRFLECNTQAVGDPATDALYRDGPAVGAGQRVTLRAFVRAPAGQVEGKLVIQALGGGDEEASVPFTAGPVWSETRVTLDVANNGHTKTRGMIRLGSAGSNLDLDDVAFYAGDAAGAPVVPANYMLWFVGDYDAAAWMASITPVTWDGKGRGLVPLAWDFSGHVATRFPPFFRHALATRTQRDFFIGADSGPGYGNPSEMDAKARSIWTKAGVRDARRLDTSSAWILNPLDPIDAEHLQAVTPYCGDGVALMSPGGVPVPSIVDHAPVLNLTNLGGDTPKTAADFIVADTGAPAAPAYRLYRAVLWKNTDLVSITHDLVENHPARRYRFVDPFTLFELARHGLGGSNAHRASFREVTFPSPIQPDTAPHVTFKVRNDGWETWHAAGNNPYRAGLHVAATSPAPRTLPSDPAGYPVRISLPADVPPGGEVSLAADLPILASEGTWTLQADMVEEGATWFETEGDIPAQLTLVVKASMGTGTGTGGAGGTGATGGTGASGGAGGAAGGGATSGSGGAGGAPGSKGGCGCQVAGESEGGSAALLAALAWMGSLRRRRRAIAMR